MKSEIPAHHHHRQAARKSWITLFSQQRPHLGRKKGRSHSHRKEHGRPKPNGHIEDANPSQQNDHGCKVGKNLPPAKGKSARSARSHGGFKKERGQLCPRVDSPHFSETHGQGCPRSFRALLESAMARSDEIPGPRLITL